MLRWAIHAGALALILAAAEGCGSGSNNSSASDSGTPDATGLDGGTEASGEGAAPGPDCGAAAPNGTQIVEAGPHDQLVVLTVTGDDHVIYENLTTQEIYGVAAAGGTPSDIGKMTSQGSTVWAHGNTLLFLPIAANPETSIAPLSSWTAAGGTSVIAKTIIAVDAYYYTYDASKDGQWVAYFASTPNSPTATLTVSTTDGKTQTPLVSGVDLTDQDCFPPAVQFVNDTLIAQYCTVPVPGDAGTTPPETATIAAFTGPTFANVTLGTTFTPSAGPVTVDPTATQALLPSPSGAGISLYPLAGGTPVTVDANGTAALFAPNGDVLYTTTSSALMRYTAATGMTMTLVPNGVALPIDLSADGNWLQVASKEDSSSGLTNLLIAPAVTPGTATSVVNTATSSPEGFTADSKYSVFGINFPPDFGPSTYDMEASLTAGGAPTKIISAAAGAYFTTGSKLVTNTNQSKSTGSADIVSIDLSTTTGPTALVTQADPHLFTTSTKALVYSWYCDQNAKGAGVWTLTPP